MTNDKVCAFPGCEGYILVDGEFCINHSPDPEYQAKVSAGRRRGSTAAARRLQVTAEDLKEFAVEPTAAAALQCQLDALAAMRAALHSDPANTKVMTQLSLAAKRLSQQVLAVDIEARLREIETELGKRKRRSG